MRRFALLFCAAALAALAVLTAIKAAGPVSPPVPAATISIQDLHRQIDTKSLPQLEVDGLY